MPLDRNENLTMRINPNQLTTSSKPSSAVKGDVANTAQFNIIVKPPIGSTLLEPVYVQRVCLLVTYYSI
jgi:hypothetical protein